MTPGHLSVYLAAAGAGKTIAVLDEGQRSRSSSSQAGESVQSTAASASKIDPSPASPGCHLPGRRFPCASEGAVMPVSLPDGLLDLLRRPSPCFLATVMPDGSPQLTQTWVTTDGEHIVINIVDGMQKARNVARDPRVAVNIADPDNSRRYFAVRGRVIAMTTEGGAESIDEISQKYLGRPYPGFSGRPQTRVIITIEADSVRAMGG